MKYWRLFLLLACAFAVVQARACPVCMGIWTQQATLADEVLAARDFVVAETTSKPDVFEIRSVIKGDADLTGRQVNASGVAETGTVILSRATAQQPWTSLGGGNPFMSGFFATILALPAKRPATDLEWNDWLGRFLPFLGHLDARVARSAWAEWARAPYRIIRSQRVEPAKLRAWLALPQHAYAQPLWLILLGTAGEAEDVRRLSEQLETAWRTNDAQLAAALLTVRMEREGVAGVAWLESHYIRDRERTLDEIIAAVAALRVQGDANETLRPHILATCHVLLSERRPLSGLVASDLVRWGDYSAAAHYRTLLASGEPVLPETRRRITDYLAACDARPNQKKGSNGD